MFFSSASESVQVVFCFIVYYMCIAVGDPVMKKTGLGYHQLVSGADPRFEVRGGALKKIAPSGGRRENCWGISCEKSRFYAKKQYFFQF